MKCFGNNGEGDLCWTYISEGTEPGQRERAIKKGAETDEEKGEGTGRSEGNI